jgi:uncharacterized protein YukE
MAQAIVDPDELRAFATSLRRYNELVAEATASLQSQFSQLGDTWRDQEQVKFAEEFDQTVRVISQFQQASEEHIPLLLRKAEDVDKYLGH